MYEGKDKINFVNESHSRGLQIKKRVPKDTLF